MNTEPFVPTQLGAVGSFGVGRIPLQSLADASVLFARGLLRERLADGRAMRVLMVSNSGRRALPLCETISRVTAEEFKNCRVAVDEFYGKLADSPEVLAAAKTAGLIIYEGHLAYQDLFDVPSAHRDTAPDSYFEEELDNLEEGGSRPPAPPTTPLHRPRRPARPAVNQIDGSMEGLPVVILQSCDSLDERVLWRIDELGGVALVGSVTPIHSGSGSGLVKALSDAVLYRGADLGRGPPRRPELPLLPGRLEDPAGAEGAGQEPAGGVEFSALGRPGVARAAGGAARRRSARRWPCAPPGPTSW